MPDDVKDGIGMPPGAVAKRLGVEGKTMACPKRHQPRIGGRSFHGKRRTEMPDDVKDGIGMPPGAVAKRLGVEGKTMACHRRGFDSLCSH